MSYTNPEVVGQQVATRIRPSVISFSVSSQVAVTTSEVEDAITLLALAH